MPTPTLTPGLFENHDAFLPSDTRRKNGSANKLFDRDRPAHDWYRFILSFPPHLVREYVTKFDLGKRSSVLDPFCGTGTTLVECKKLGIPSVGIEGNPMAHFAAHTKTDWSLDADALTKHAEMIAASVLGELRRHGLKDDGDDSLPLPKGRKLRALPPEHDALLLSHSISPLPLHKVLVLRDRLNAHATHPAFEHERLALAKAIVTPISNLHFGPEVGVGPPKRDVPVVKSWLKEVHQMAADLRELAAAAKTSAIAYHSDARRPSAVLKPASVDAVITSPPYPNEKDYTRTTRLESVILGFIGSRDDLRDLKRGLVRSNTRGVYRNDDDDQWVREHREIGRIADAIEARRLELGKTSGFERMYHRVTRLYFGGMARHLAELRPILRPNAQLAYVVGDQASYLRVMIRTGELIADIAQSLGYRVSRIDLFRTRLATATREQLREEVVVLRWPG